MAYTKYIEKFWKTYRNNFVSAHAALVFFALVDISRKQNGKNPIYLLDESIMGKTLLDGDNYFKGKEELAKTGLVKFIELKNKKGDLVYIV